MYSLAERRRRMLQQVPGRRNQRAGALLTATKWRPSRHTVFRILGILINLRIRTNDMWIYR
jgi:hypothetical protein